MITAQGPTVQVHAVRMALQALGDALAMPAAGSLADAESALSAALSACWPHRLAAGELPTDARVALAQEIEATRAALARCQRLGDSLAAFVSASLAGQGLVAGYGRHGDEAIARPAAHFGARG